MTIYEDFESLETVEKPSYVLGSELWESKFNVLLGLLKEYIVNMWERQKHKLNDSDSESGLVVSLVRMVILVRNVKCI